MRKCFCPYITSRHYLADFSHLFFLSADDVRVIVRLCGDVAYQSTAVLSGFVQRNVRGLGAIMISCQFYSHFQSLSLAQSLHHFLEFLSFPELLSGSVLYFILFLSLPSEHKEH